MFTLYFSQEKQKASKMPLENSQTTFSCIKNDEIYVKVYDSMTEVVRTSYNLLKGLPSFGCL